MGHVYLRAQNAGAVGKLALAHPAKQVQGLRYAPVAKRAVAPRPLEAPASVADRLTTLVVDLCPSFADQPLATRAPLRAVVGRIAEVGPPTVTPPAPPPLNRI